MEPHPRKTLYPNQRQPLRSARVEDPPADPSPPAASSSAPEIGFEDTVETLVPRTPSVTGA